MLDETPFQVLDDFPDTGDISDQTGQDVLDPAKQVQFVVQEVKPDVFKSKDTGDLLTARLNVRAAIGSQGVNGEGKYKNKVMFLELLTWFNPEKYTSDWWKTQARNPYKMFLKALSYDPASPPKVTDEFLTELKGREFVADIRKVPIRVKNDEGKYVATDTMKNELVNFRGVV